MKSRFEPDAPGGATPLPATLVDPEAYDASEQQFAASLEQKPQPVPRFVVDQETVAGDSPRDHAAQSSLKTKNDPLEASPLPLNMDSASPTVNRITEATPEDEVPDAPSPTGFLTPPDTDSWRQEVASRVNNYRARRRPREPRYPSLQLKFDPPDSATEPDSWRNPDPRDHKPRTRRQPANQLDSAFVVNRLAVAVQNPLLNTSPETQPNLPAPDPRPTYEPEPSNILEFPRSAAIPLPALDELADPVFDRPRILEVPELVPPPPALGGILMDPSEAPAQERRPGFELPLQSAPLSRRLTAAAIDAVVVGVAFAGFAYIFFRITSSVPPVRQAVGVSFALTGVLWIAYQFLLLVYSGTTPGLMLAKLQLNRFDGSPVPQNLRRWRVLASVLSGLSLALGYAWCFMDEDELCWHDRITQTYMAPKPAAQPSKCP